MKAVGGTVADWTDAHEAGTIEGRTSAIGLFLFLGHGHLIPGVAVGRALKQRGHRVTIFHVQLAGPTIRRYGLEFQALDRGNFRETRRLAAAGRRLRWKDTVDAILEHAELVFRAGLQAASRAGVEAIVADQFDVAAGSVAEHLGVPFVTLSCAPPLSLSPEVPPPLFRWRHASGRVSRIRNRIGNALIEIAAAPIVRRVNAHRRGLGLRPLRRVNDLWSTRGIVTQLPASLDFPRTTSGQICHVGPMRILHEAEPIPFPWHKLDGRPIVFGSMGTIQNNDPSVFRIIADAASGLGVQLVLSLGGGLVTPQDLGVSTCDTIVVPFAPQRDIIQRAVCVVSCAGLNTTLDALVAGVPLVAIPVADDQHGVAARIAASQVGIVLPRKRLTVSTLRTAIRVLIGGSIYGTNAQRFKRELSDVDGASQAAAAIESLFGWPASCGGRQS